jgi:hypothetical protein
MRDELLLYINSRRINVSGEQAFFCPVGLDLGNNQPQEIAISIAAQLLKERDRWRNSPQKSLPAECHGKLVFEQN